jgi:hypothetical protein
MAWPISAMRCAGVEHMIEAYVPERLLVRFP